MTFHRPLYDVSTVKLHKCDYAILIFQPEHVTSKLKCFLKPTLIPFLFGKEEVFNYDPRVSMFHDVITESEQQLLKNKVLDRVCINFTLYAFNHKIRFRFSKDIPYFFQSQDGFSPS